MDEITLRRLMLVKRLFLHGTLHSEKNTELDRFLAIHHFDNAIELFLKILASKEGVVTSSRQDFKFKELWEAVNNKLESKSPIYSLPIKDQIFAMHDTRNLAQHQGDAPAQDTMIKYEGYSKDFLLKCSKDIFQIDFEEVHSSVLVVDTNIRHCLVEAEKKMTSHQYKESIEESAKAFAQLKATERDASTYERLRHAVTFGILQDPTIKVKSLYSSNRSEQQIINMINTSLQDYHGQLNSKLREDARKINEFARDLEEELAVLKLGVDYKEFRSFKKIIPYVILTSAEPMISHRTEENYNKENALFCHNFILELVLRLQSSGQ